MSDLPLALLMRALESDDAATVEALIQAHPALLNSPDKRPAVMAARSVSTAERLLTLGADVEAAGKWWASGLGSRSVTQRSASCW